MKRVYRAVADYETHAVTRDFLTKRARDAWAKQRREGYPEQIGLYAEDDGRAAIPPARSVQLFDSEPLVFRAP